MDFLLSAAAQAEEESQPRAAKAEPARPPPRARNRPAPRKKKASPAAAAAEEDERLSSPSPEPAVGEPVELSSPWLKYAENQQRPTENGPEGEDAMDSDEGGPRCFSCNRPAGASSSLTQCSKRNGAEQCPRQYHPACLVEWGAAVKWIGPAAAAITKGAPPPPGGAFECPQHACSACRDVRRERLTTCALCPTAYHDPSCLSPTAALVGGALVCWRHDPPGTGTGVSGDQCPAPRGLRAALARLPLPAAGSEADFRLPASLLAEHKRLQNAPPPWVHLRRNEYPGGKRPKAAKGATAGEAMDCTCAQGGGDGGEDRCCTAGGCMCALLATTCSKACGCGVAGQCSNAPFFKRPAPKLKPFRTPLCGWGVQTTAAIPAGAFVIEYTGEVVDDAACEQRLWAMREAGATDFYMLEMSSAATIDATRKGNLARLVNHSCAPNCELQKWRDGAETCVGLFALREIAAGEELCYDYQFTQFGAVTACHCGGATCTGAFGKALPPPVMRPARRGDGDDDPGATVVSTIPSRRVPGAFVGLALDERIDCGCGDNREFGAMCACSACGAWEHLQCAGYTAEVDVPDDYTCAACRAGWPLDAPAVKAEARAAPKAGTEGRAVVAAETPGRRTRAAGRVGWGMAASPPAVVTSASPAAATVAAPVAVPVAVPVDVTERGDGGGHPAAAVAPKDEPDAVMEAPQAEPPPPVNGHGEALPPNGHAAAVSPAKRLKVEAV